MKSSGCWTNTGRGHPVAASGAIPVHRGSCFKRYGLCAVSGSPVAKGFAVLSSASASPHRSRRATAPGSYSRANADGGPAGPSSRLHKKFSFGIAITYCPFRMHETEKNSPHPMNTAEQILEAEKQMQIARLAADTCKEQAHREARKADAAKAAKEKARILAKHSKKAAHQAGKAAVDALKAYKQSVKLLESLKKKEDRRAKAASKKARHAAAKKAQSKKAPAKPSKKAAETKQVKKAD